MTAIQENLSGLILDLHDVYGSAFPRPQGMVVKFQVVHDNTTFKKAKAEIEALLTLHGIIPSDLQITPGPEVKGKFNRSVKFSISTDLLT
jgi:hypothetical protein